MIDLNEKIFGKITAKEIIGSEPDHNETENLLVNELERLEQNLEGLEKLRLEELKEKQIQLEKLMNSRPGAMAISQEKIRLFTKYSQNYIEKIQTKLKNKITEQK